MGLLLGAQQSIYSSPTPNSMHLNVTIGLVSHPFGPHQQQKLPVSAETKAACPLCLMRGPQQGHRGPSVLRASVQTTEVTIAPHELEAKLNKRAKLDSASSPAQRSSPSKLSFLCLQILTICTNSSSASASIYWAYWHGVLC